MEEKNESALEFLHGLETRHSQVLEDLETLNTRIESVLDAYAQSRKPPATCDIKAENAC